MTYKKRRRTLIMVINEFLLIAAGMAIGITLLISGDIRDFKIRKQRREQDRIK